jgi:hypothetical protein
MKTKRQPTEKKKVSCGKKTSHPIGIKMVRTKTEEIGRKRIRQQKETKLASQLEARESASADRKKQGLPKLGSKGVSS